VRARLGEHFVSAILYLANKISSGVAYVFALANVLQRLSDLGMLMLTKKLPSYSLPRTYRNQILEKFFVIKGFIIIPASLSWLTQFLLMYL
jgi:hypothetical protein